MENNWVQQLFSSIDKLLDILNLGRLIFYPAAGILAVYPIVMTLKLLELSKKPDTFIVALPMSYDSKNPG